MIKQQKINYFHANIFYAKKNIREFKHNGIDRLINSIGYVFDNCVSCCYVCNKMKMNLDYTVFINQIIKINKNKNLS